jgi:hypothetical protein
MVNVLLLTYFMTLESHLEAVEAHSGAVENQSAVVVAIGVLLSS